MADSLPDIAALRAQAQALRTQADDIDRRVDEFIAWSRSLPFPIISPPLSIKGVRPSLISAATVSPGSFVQDTKRRGKPPGAISMVWRRHYAAARLFDGEVFPLKTVIENINQHDGTVARPTAVRRHLKNHIEHGYLELVGEDTYRMTQKLLGMLDKLHKHEDNSAHRAEQSSPSQEGETGGDTPPVSLPDIL